MQGFHCNLSLAAFVHAEIWGLVYGLRKARRLAPHSLLVELDSQVVVNMLMSRRTQFAYLQPALDEALGLLDDPAWSCIVRHVHREANQCAYLLEGLGHNGSFQCSVLEHASVVLWLALDVDCRGISSRRLVR